MISRNKFSRFRIQQGYWLKFQTSRFYDLFTQNQIIDSQGACLDIHNQIDFLPTCRQVTDRIYQIQSQTLRQFLNLINPQFIITPFGISIYELLDAIDYSHPGSIQTQYQFTDTSELSHDIKYQPQRHPFYSQNSSSKTQIIYRNQSSFQTSYIGTNLHSSSFQKPIQAIDWYQQTQNQGLYLEDFLIQYLFKKTYSPETIRQSMHLIWETFSSQQSCVFLMEINKDQKLTIIPVDPADKLPNRTQIQNKVEF